MLPLPLIAALMVTAGRASEMDLESKVSVSGSHEVSVMPTSVEIMLTTSSKAELSGDVVTKFRAAAKQVVEACQSLGIKGLKVDQQGFLLGSEAEGGNAFQVVAGQKNDAKTQMWLGCKVKLVISNIQGMKEDELMDIISRILDTAKDAGATLATPAGNNMMRAVLNSGGVTPAVTFVVDNADQAHKEARQKAFQKAKANAQELASLAGLKLGVVRSVAEIGGDSASPGEADMQMQIVSAIYGAGGDKSSSNPNRITSDRFGPLTIKSNLAVTFALIP